MNTHQTQNREAGERGVQDESAARRWAQPPHAHLPPNWRVRETLDLKPQDSNPTP